MPDRLPLILVCDDTPAKRYIICSWLRRAGYRVMEASTAGDARRILQEAAVDLAVLDVHLPDGNGLDITRDLRRDPARAATPVVHVSAIAVETVDRVAALDTGADAYLIDPIEPEELLSSIRALLRSSGARRDAEELARRMGRLNGAAVRIHVASTTARLAGAIAGAASEVLGEPAVSLVVEDGSLRRASAAPRGAVDISDVVLPADILERLDAAADVNGLLTVESDADPWNTFLPRTGPRRWRVCSLQSDGERVGLLAVPVSEVQTNDDFLLGRLAQIASVAFENLRALERERQTALVLQRSLLPASLPEPAGLVIAARYRASERHAEVGGDFFDAFEVEGGCFIAIGDVQGHSLQAAVVMAELRYSLRAYAYDGYGPAQITDRLDEVLTRNQPGIIATACIARISADRRTMTVVSAGHPPLLLLRDGEVSQIKPRGVLLGLRSSHREATFELRGGDRLLLLTDGLVERRTEPMHVTLGRLEDAVSGMADLSAEPAADRVLADYGVSDDDVALMVVDILPSTSSHPQG